jgi:hypothetical protein
MKITMLRNPAASFGCKLGEGQTGDIDKELAERLIELNIAVPFVKEEKIKGVPEEPQIKAESK